MATAGGIWAPAALRLLRIAATNTSRAVRAKFAQVSRPAQAELHTIPVRNSSNGRQPVHPAAVLKQQKRGVRWHSGLARNVNGIVRRWMSSGSSGYRAPKIDRSAFPSSNTSQRVGQFTGRAPFASTLRPNLTGGSIPRTQGGYSLGGGARYFSHTPAAPAQVVQNVSQAMRAFCLSGQKIRYDGLNARGDKYYRAVSPLEQEAYVKMASLARTAPGSFIDFHLNPTITALSPLVGAFPYPSVDYPVAQPAGLNDDGFFDVLSVDFARALKDLTTIFADLKRLSHLGNLPLQFEGPHVLRVRFPGVDAETVERLCDDVGVQRGVIGQDLDFGASAAVSMALQFPFAPDSEAPKTLTSPGGSLRSLSGLEIQEAFIDEYEEDPWLSDPEGYESMSPHLSSGENGADFEGLEGIYRFLEECDRAKGRF